MRNITKFILFCAAALLMAACAKEAPAGYDLRFNADGKFRILQLTDVHLAGENADDYNSAKNQMVSVVDREHPDVVIFTGDVVTTVPAKPWWDDFFKPLDERNLPYVVVYGNHDRERELNEYELAQTVTAHSANINVLDEHGLLSDMALQIKSADGRKVSAVLYCIDSSDYPTVTGFGGFGWIAGDRIEWYRHQSNAFAAANDGFPVPSYAFFHIPLCEYNVAYEKGLALEGGHKLENECAGSLNSGMFTAMLECGDVHGVFVGHDHVNDYVAPYGGIALTYGRVAGFNTTYGTDKLPHGLRVIDLTEGEYGFDTFVSLNDGGTMSEIQYRDSTDYTVHAALAPDTALAEGERLLDVPENGHWTFRKTRGRGYEVAIDDIVVCKVGNRESGVIALEKGLHKVRVTPVAEDAAREPFHLAWRRAGSGIMREVPLNNYVK